MTTPRHAYAQRTRDVPCTHCGAAPGAPCTGPGGTRHRVHYARAVTARQRGLDARISAYRDSPGYPARLRRSLV